MFLDFFRDRSLKRNLEVAVASYAGPTPSFGIKRLGLLIDATQVKQLEGVMGMASQLRANSQVTTLCYVHSVRKGFHAISTFDKKALDWKGNFKKGGEVEYFMSQTFDLLISYYATDNLLLRYLTAISTAHFKVGFPIEGVRQLNDLVIDTPLDDVGGFATELINYLRILKRLD